MNIKKLLLLAVIPMVGVVANAQEQKCTKGQKKCPEVCALKDYTPKKKDITVALTFGYSDYIHVSAINDANWGTSGYQMQALSNDWNQKSLGLGAEFGVFSGDTWKWTFGAGISFVGNPGYGQKEGTVTQTEAVTDEDGIYNGEIPSYRAVAGQNSFNYNVSAACAKYFKVKKVPNLMPYVGLKASFAYGMNEAKYDEYQGGGNSLAETFNIRGAVTMGIDYFFAKGVYFGIQIDPIAYTYNMTSYKPMEGLSTLSGDSHNVSFLSTPTAKIGFKF